MKIFQGDDNFWGGDKSLLALAKTLGSYIEIDFDMQSVAKSIDALSSSNWAKKKTNTSCDLGSILGLDVSDVLNDFRPSIEEYEKNKNQVQGMRDSLWAIRDELGTYCTLMFISPSLVLSLEMLFSGAIVMYCKAFSSSQRRTVLNADKVFANDSMLLDFHNHVFELRNKHFAHSELSVNKHILACFLNGRGELNFNTDFHTHGEFWENFDYERFYSLIVVVRKYLKNEISGKIRIINERLTDEQRKCLLAMHDSGHD